MAIDKRWSFGRGRLAGLLLASMPVALAAPPDVVVGPYSYLELGLLSHEDTPHTDRVRRGDKRTGYRAAFQVALPARPWAFFTEYDKTDQLDLFSVGTLHARPLLRGVAVMAGAAIEFEDMTDEKGYGLRGGLRWMPVSWLELMPEVRHVELFEANTSVRVTVSAALRGHLRAQAVAQFGDDQRYVVGIRYAVDGRGSGFGGPAPGNQ